MKQKPRLLLNSQVLFLRTRGKKRVPTTQLDGEEGERNDRRVESFRESPKRNLYLYCFTWYSLHPRFSLTRGKIKYKAVCNVRVIGVI